MRITSKGQVTIPAEIRALTGLLPNTGAGRLHSRANLRSAARSALVVERSL